MRYMKAFFGFWWNFLVGDTPEISVGVVVILTTTALVGHHGFSAALTPLLVVAVLSFAIALTLRKSPTKKDSPS